MNKDNVHTLFSSTKCKYCQLFLQTLNKHMMMDQFNVIDIDRTTYDVSKVKVVPTIIVTNNKALSGRDAFSWLQHEIDTSVSSVETYGTSSQYLYVGEDRAEFAMSSQFVPIEESEMIPQVESKPVSNKEADLADAMARLKSERENL